MTVHVYLCGWSSMRAEASKERKILELCILNRLHFFPLFLSPCGRSSFCAWEKKKTKYYWSAENCSHLCRCLRVRAMKENKRNCFAYESMYGYCSNNERQNLSEVRFIPHGELLSKLEEQSKAATTRCNEYFALSGNCALLLGFL